MYVNIPYMDPMGFGFSAQRSRKFRAGFPGRGKRRNPGRSHDDLMWHIWWIFLGECDTQVFLPETESQIFRLCLYIVSVGLIYLFNTLVDRRTLYHTSISKFTILLNPIRSFKAKEASRSTIS